MEINDSVLMTYSILLMLSGVLMIVLAATGFGTDSVGARVFSGLVGLAFTGYGFYLFFLFEGGRVWVLWYAFVLPIVLIFRAVKAVTAKKSTETA
jgi:hypothetical protein